MYEDLIDLAEFIAAIDKKKPKQAHLRRAVSTAYYAVFHYLVDEACCAQIGTHHTQKEHRHALGRAFSHTVMKDACTSFAGGTLKESVAKGLPRNSVGQYIIPTEIRDIARTFAELQGKRHLADYDLTERFRKSEVLTLIGQARAHVESFRLLTNSDVRKFFLASLWAWKELKNR